MSIPFYGGARVGFSACFSSIVKMAMPGKSVRAIMLEFSRGHFPCVMSGPLRRSRRIGLRREAVAVGIGPGGRLSRLVLSFVPSMRILSPRDLESAVGRGVRRGLGGCLSTRGAPLGRNAFMRWDRRRAPSYVFSRGLMRLSGVLRSFQDFSGVH